MIRKTAEKYRKREISRTSSRKSRNQPVGHDRTPRKGEYYTANKVKRRTRKRIPEGDKIEVGIKHINLVN